MKLKIKRIIVSAMAATVFISFSPIKCFAWGGYAHYLMGGIISQNAGLGINEAYRSGCLIADVGKATFDAIATDSDSYEFSRHIRDLSYGSDWNSNQKQFVAGWFAHYVQDQYGSVMGNIKTSKKFSSGYRAKCGWVDQYYRDVYKAQNPINGGTYVYVYYDAIRQTYKDLDNYSPSDSQIDTQIGTMYNMYKAQILLNPYSDWTTDERASIENEINRTVKLCQTSSAFTGLVAPNNKAINSNKSEKGIENAKKISTKEKIKKKLLEINTEDVAKITRTPADDKGGYWVKYTIIDNEKYDKKLNEVVNMIKGSGFSFDELY